MTLMRRVAALLITLTTAACGEGYLVLLKDPGAVAYYDAAGKLAATVNVAGQARDIVLSADGKYAYISDAAVSIIDVAGQRVTGTIDLGNYHEPRGLALDRATGNLLVATEAPNQLLLLDTQKRGVIRTYDTKGEKSHAVAVDAAGKWAYVSNAASSTVSAIDLKKGAVKTIQTGKTPARSILSPDGRELYVCNRDDNTITVIDTKRNAAIALIETGQGPTAIDITPDGERLVYALTKEKRIGIADAKTRKQTDYALLTENPISLRLSRDGNLALVTVDQQNVVYIVSIADRHIRQEFRTAAGSAPIRVRERQ